MDRHTDTTIPSIWIIFIFLAIVEIDYSDEIKWITNPRTINACIGHDEDLLWKFDEEENTISSLEWYFNKTLICTSSDTENFTVSPPYKDRIERLNRTEIRLKNVSLDDEGIYMLFPLLDWSTSQNMQNISLQVLEPPTHKCTCKINCTEHASNLICELTIPDCGRPQVTAVWKLNETLEVLGQGNYLLINSSIHGKEILCCPEGTAMKCVDDSQQFCTPIQIPYRNDESPSEGGKSILPVDTATTRAPNHCDTESSNSCYIQVFLLPIIALTVSLVTAIFAMLAFREIYRLRKMNKELGAQVCFMQENWNLNIKGKEMKPTLPSTDREQHEQFQNVQEPEERFPLLPSYSRQHDNFKTDQEPKTMCSLPSTPREQHQDLNSDQEEETSFAVPSTPQKENENFKNNQEPGRLFPELPSSRPQHEDFKSEQVPKRLYPNLQEEKDAL